MPTVARPLAERFAKMVGQPDARGCRLWQGPLHSGYGRIAAEPGSAGPMLLRAHRVAWSLANGPIPDGMHVCHRCDVPACVNVEHLFLGTDADNLADRDSKGRQARGSANGRAKLTEAAVREIRRLLHSGRPRADLATVFGVSVAAIDLIAIGRSWRTVR